MSDVCRPLATDAERAVARAAIRRMYEAQGYETNGDGITRYLENSASTTFGLFVNDTLYGTISLIMDSPQGFPMDSIYSEELSPWRKEGKKIAEVVQFAVDHSVYKKLMGKSPSPFAAAPLFAVVLSRAIEEHIDYLCISINPKHDRFYAMLGFKQIGPLKHYGSVNAPAIARALEVENWRSNPLLRTFFGKSIARHMPASG